MYLGQIAEYIWDSEVDDGTLDPVTDAATVATEKQMIADALAVNVGQLNIYLNTLRQQPLSFL